MKIRLLLLLLLFSFATSAQELFPHTEIASSVPKNVLGVRLFGESYSEYGTQRNLGALKLMYGLTSRLSVSVTGTTSNHHSDHLPSGLITHTHVNTDTLYQTGSFTRGIHYPYRFNGIYAFAKYRVLTIDGQNTHIRAGLYVEGSYINTAHDEAEPTLLDDTKGWGSGFMTTYLSHHFAVSLNCGVIIPGTYKEVTPDFYGGELHTELTYGNAVQYNLSFGYLVYPHHYSSYSQTNFNVYLEFMGKSYETAKVVQNNRNIEPKTDLLLKGNYIEMHPGIQAIINSNLRIDFAVGFPVYNKSYARFYPVFLLGVQQYVFFSGSK